MNISNDYLWWTSIIFFILILILNYQNKQLQKLKHDKNSQSVRYGKISEQFMPFMKDYPYNPQNFRFIGSPIDGIQFEDNKIIIMEFKTSNSHQTEKQERIEQIVYDKKVYYEKIQIK